MQTPNCMFLCPRFGGFGTIETRSYDVMNRLASVATTGPGGLLSQFIYTVDATGNRIAVQEADGRTVVYAYDMLNRLVSEAIKDPVAGTLHA